MTGTALCKYIASTCTPGPPSLHPRTCMADANLAVSRTCRTFLKRKGGLFKKAHELSVLCSVDVAVFIFGSNKKLYEYSSCDMRDLITRYTFVSRRDIADRRPEPDF